MRRNADHRSELLHWYHDMGSWDTSSAGEKVSARRLRTTEKTMKMKYKISTHARTHARTSTAWVRGSTWRGADNVAS